MAKRRYTLIAITATLFLAVIAYNLPPVHSRLAWRVEALRIQIKYFFNPPEDVIFVPVDKLQLTPTMIPVTLTSTTTPQSPEMPTTTPTITSTPVPSTAKLTGFVYANQCNRWNYCGPANLTMALTYWGWNGNRDDVAAVIKPGENNPEMNFIDRGRSDFNIMPYEMADFVNQKTESRALYRYGGDTDLLKRMIAAGFPVIIEKGYYQRDTSGRISWMGHYSFVTGYDDAQKKFVWQDSYPNRCQDKEKPALVEQEGRDNLISYDDLLAGWRSFDYVFIVVYPENLETAVMQALGPWADWNWSAQNALETARLETATLKGNDQFFAAFNVGTSQVALQQYLDSASAFDVAFKSYSGLSNDDSQRPYRILWYETGAYWAYYYTGRYQDVINLADTTLTYLVSMPSLEESLYWRAMAEYALGQTDDSFSDMRKAVYYNKNFQAALAQLQEWGISP
jgi:hypothetical protein